MNNFYVGQKVVCFSVNPSPYPCHHIEVSKLQINKIYTIREIIKFSDRYSLRLVEIVNEPRYFTNGFGEASYKIVRFKPLIEKKTDISIFTEILNNSTKELVE